MTVSSDTWTFRLDADTTDMAPQILGRRKSS